MGLNEDRYHVSVNLSIHQFICAAMLCLHVTLLDSLVLHVRCISDTCSYDAEADSALQMLASVHYTPAT